MPADIALPSLSEVCLLYVLVEVEPGSLGRAGMRNLFVEMPQLQRGAIPETLQAGLDRQVQRRFRVGNDSVDTPTENSLRHIDGADPAAVLHGNSQTPDDVAHLV